MKKITISVIKADVGSVGGHTKPSEKMLARMYELMRKGIEIGLLIDGTVKYFGYPLFIGNREGWIF